MENYGVYKRDILIDRVQDVRDAQEKSKQQFQSALDRFSRELSFDGGDLEENSKNSTTNM